MEWKSHLKTRTHIMPQICAIISRLSSYGLHSIMLKPRPSPSFRLRPQHKTIRHVNLFKKKSPTINLYIGRFETYLVTTFPTFVTNAYNKRLLAHINSLQW